MAQAFCVASYKTLNHIVPRSPQSKTEGNNIALPNPGLMQSCLLDFSLKEEKAVHVFCKSWDRIWALKFSLELFSCQPPAVSKRADGWVWSWLHAGRREGSFQKSLLLWILFSLS